jgi:uncharacterized protein (TIGR00369 family)
MSDPKSFPDKMREEILLSSFHKLLGFKIKKAGEGYVHVLMPNQESIMTNKGYIHGGAIAALIDVAGDYAIGTVFGRTWPTIDMRVDYLRAGKSEEDLVARATVVKKGRSLSIADITVVNPEEKVLAIGRALYQTSTD